MGMKLIDRIKENKQIKARLKLQGKSKFRESVGHAMDGINYTILRYLGYQIVSGTNYALLCSGTTVTNPPTTQLYVVIIYKDLNGNCSILSSTPVLGIAG